MIIWKIGQTDEFCAHCKKRLGGEVAASSTNIRICRDCFVQCGPEDIMAWMLVESQQDEEKALTLAKALVKEMYEWGRVVVVKKSFCPKCLGIGFTGCYTGGKREKCPQCNGEGIYDCKECGNAGITKEGKCKTCRI